MKARRTVLGSARPLPPSIRSAYLSCQNDDERRGFVEAALANSHDMPDGAFCGMMQEMLGDDWPDVLERLGLDTAGPPEEP